jgi:transcription initiation factor IIE alpha subunit
MANLKPKVQTWINNVKNGRINSKTEKILSFIYQRTMYFGTAQDLFNRHPGMIATDDLRERLGYTHQTLTAILSNLQDEGVIKVVGEKAKGSEVYSYWTFEMDPEQIELNKENREREKFFAWCKRSVEFQKFLSVDLVEEILVQSNQNKG